MQGHYIVLDRRTLPKLSDSVGHLDAWQVAQKFIEPPTLLGARLVALYGDTTGFEVVQDKPMERGPRGRLRFDMDADPAWLPDALCHYYSHKAERDFEEYRARLARERGEA